MKTVLKNSCIGLLFLASILLSGCGGGDGGDCVSEVSSTNIPAEETLALQDIDAGSRTLFGLIGVNGNITISGDPSTDTIMIDGTKRVRSESFGDAQGHLADIVVDVDLAESPNAVFVETIQPECTGGRIYEVDYTVTLPSDFVVLVENFNGNVSIDTIDNSVSVVLFNGDVSLLRINGSASATLFNGTIDAGDGIDAGVTLPANGEIKFDVVNGVINLDIPVGTSAGFSARTVNGIISISNLNLDISGGTPPKSLIGTLGDGQGTIDLEVDNGDINVTGL